MLGIFSSFQVKAIHSYLCHIKMYQAHNSFFLSSFFLSFLFLFYNFSSSSFLFTLFSAIENSWDGRKQEHDLGASSFPLRSISSLSFCFQHCNPLPFVVEKRMERKRFYPRVLLQKERERESADPVANEERFFTLFIPLLSFVHRTRFQSFITTAPPFSQKFSVHSLSSRTSFELQNQLSFATAAISFQEFLSLNLRPKKRGQERRRKEERRGKKKGERRKGRRRKQQVVQVSVLDQLQFCHISLSPIPSSSVET